MEVTRDITCIDLRPWGVGFKGVACLSIYGRMHRTGSMTSGGLSKKKGRPAEVFMQRVPARYQGDMIDYAQSETKIY